MADVVIMPRQGQSVESCILAKWHKHKGDSVSVGDILFSYETDKTAFEEEAKVSGTMLELFFKEGDDIPCLTNVCVIGEAGEDVSAYAPSVGEEEAQDKGATNEHAAADDAKKRNIQQGQPVQAASISQDGRLPISPRARVLAERVGADAANASPTGPGGRIIERDIQKLAAEGALVTPAARAGYSAGSQISGTGIGGRVTVSDLTAAPKQAVQSGAADMPEYEEVALSGIRKIIAKTMYSSLMESAQLTLNTSFDATDIFEFRSRLKAKAEKLSVPVVSVTDIIAYTVSRVLMRHKSLNAHFFDDKMRIYNTAHIGIATDTPRGLMVPVVFNADRLSLTEISAHAKELFGMCRQGSISPDLISGGTFTISNLGTFGIESFTPVLNPPETALLGVCSITERTKDGKPYPAMGLSLTFDHRAMDGADAARFLKELVDNLESFSVMAALN